MEDKKAENQPVDSEKEIEAPKVAEPQFDTENYKELSALESGGVQGEEVSDATKSPLATSQYARVSSEKKSHAGVFVALGVAIALLVLPGMGMAYWYVGVRTPDVEYEKTAATLNAMMDSAKSIEVYRESVKSNKNEASYTSVSSVKLAATLDDEQSRKIDELKIAKDRAAEFLENERVLAASSVIDEDPNLKAVYDTNKKVITDYARSADEYYRTGHKFLTVYSYCNAGIEGIKKYGDKLTLAEFNAEMKFCSDRLMSTEALASEKFNKAFYTQYRESFLGYIDATRDMFEATTQKELDAALQKMTTAQFDLAKTDTSKIDEIKPTQQPIDQLKRLKEKVEERKQVFFR